MNESLPIEQIRTAFEEHRDRGPVVVSAPTGSGKSTQVPRWLRRRGPVLVVEPRRVACRALAARVAELEGCEPGREVGYVVRDEHVAGDKTGLLFVTPGVALLMIASGEHRRYATLVLDEFHERSMDLDLILALALADAHAPTLVVMSATLQGDRVARHVGGVHLHGEGRQYPVTTRHVPGRCAAPDERGLADRVLRALDLAEGDPGDVLVFLPGKGEIAKVGAAVRRHGGYEVLPLHGRLSLEEQSRVFRPGSGRRVVLSTNVAETSLTIPGIGVVVDSGLVRRTQYHNGRGYLALVPIAGDSAEQRAGRAGRLRPGVCYRLWRQDVDLEPVTPPEIHREDLTSLVLSAAACGAFRLCDLPFLDPPRSFAVQEARDTLEMLGALEPGDRLTSRGERMFGLPLDVRLARLLIEGEHRGNLADVVDLCAGLLPQRPLFRNRPEDPDFDLREEGCDAVARIRAVREGRVGPHGLDRQALAEARQAARRLRRLFRLPRSGTRSGVDRRELALTVMAAWPDAPHVARRRKRHVAWSNGGTELELGHECAVDPARTEALLVLDSRAFRHSYRDKRLVITAAMPVALPWIVQAGIGRERLAGVEREGDRLVARVERVHAGRVIHTREDSPRGAMAREAVRDLYLAGELFGDQSREARRRHERQGLYARLHGRSPPPDLGTWVLRRLEALELEEPDDLALLLPEDLLPPELPELERQKLERDFPRFLSIGDASYRIRYRPDRKEATLHQVSGTRKTRPASMYLPRLPGWRLLWEYKNRVRVLRER